MGDTRVKSSMVDLNLRSAGTTTLESFIKSTEVLPIDVFLESNLSQAITDALAYLANKRQGSVYIPSQSDGEDKPTQIVAIEDKSGNLRLNYITQGYRYPINDEKRPFTNDDWQLGDIIINNDINTNRNYAWICIDSGTPGNWMPYGFIKKWFTEVEKVDALPDPSVLQEGRQLICKDENGLSLMYYCAQIDDKGTYAWVKQNIFESDIEDKIEELFTPRWEQLMIDLDANLSQRITPAVNLYFSENPIPLLRVTGVETDSSGNWVVTSLENDTPYASLPDRFILVVKLPSKSAQNTKLKLLENEISVCSYSGAEITEGELAKDILAQFTIDKTAKVAYYSSGSRIADNTSYLNVNVSLHSISTTPPTDLSGIVVTAKGSNGDTYEAETNSAGACLLEVPADDYEVTCSGLDDYVCKTPVNLLKNAIKAKTTVVPLTMNYTKGKLILHLTNNYSSATYTGIPAKVSAYDAAGELVSENTYNVSTNSTTQVSDLDGSLKYVVTIEKANYPTGTALDADITIDYGELIDAEVRADLILVDKKLKQTLLSFIISNNNSDPNGKVVYADDAVGMTGGSLDWMSTWPFSEVYPALIRRSDKKILKLDKTNVLKYEDGTSAASDIASTNFNAVVILPKFWYKFEWISSTQLKVSVSDVEDAGFEKFPKNSKYDYAFKGMFEGYVNNSVMYSLSGKTVTASQTIATFRNQAKAQGSGYCQNTFEINKALEILYILYYKGLHSQALTGNGNSNSNSYLATGTMNSVNTGTLAHHCGGTTANTTTGMKFLWIENFWANYWEFVDGILINAYQVYLQDDPDLFADVITGYTATGESVLTTSDTYVKDVIGSNNCGFLAKTGGGSETTDYCDYYWIANALQIALFGGRRGDGGYCGAFCWYLNNVPSSSHTNICSRLCGYLTEEEYQNVA